MKFCTDAFFGMEKILNQMCEKIKCVCVREVVFEGVKFGDDAFV